MIALEETARLTASPQSRSARALDAIRKVCEAAGLEIAGVEAYANPLRPEETTAGFTIDNVLRERIRASAL